MGARWSWSAICKNGHIYGNFSGGADNCYTCGSEPEREIADEGLPREEVEALLRGPEVCPTCRRPFGET